MRLFFAIWPSPDAAARLQALSAAIAEETGGRAPPPDNIHLTLEFLGEVAGERIEELGAIARSIGSRAFTLRLDRLGAFRRARIAWVGSEEVPPALRDLQGRLNERLRAAGFSLEERQYSPHITLARNTMKPVPKRVLEPIEWRVGEFTLVRSEPGRAKYTTLAAWPLR